MKTNFAQGGRSGRGEVRRILEDLVRIKSVNPVVDGGRGESDVAEYMAGAMRSLGLRVSMQRVLDGRSNVVGVLKGGGGGRSLMLNGHMDTVGVSGMSADPFRPRVDRHGRLHGRGSADMKGALAAMLAAAGCLADSGAALSGDLTLAAVVDEEDRGTGTKRLVEEYRADAAIVGEPTRLNLAVAHKGFAWVEVEARGRAAHGSRPELGVDAIAEMGALVALLPSLGRRYAAGAGHPLLGRAKLHTSTIEGGTEWAVVPDRCVLRLEKRTLPGEGRGLFLAEVQSLIQRLRNGSRRGAGGRGFSAEARLVFEESPLETPRDEPVVRALEESVRSVRGRAARVVGLPYWTDGATLKSAGIPTCVFGPGDIALAHTADEHVSLAEVREAVDIYHSAVLRFCAP